MNHLRTEASFFPKISGCLSSFGRPVSLELWHVLPADIKSNIFQYDDTYKEKMKNEVALDIWKTKWTTWINNIECPYKRFIMEYLFRGWEDNRAYCKKNIFPDNITISLREIRTGIEIRVDNGDENLFDGWILDEYDYREKIWLEYDHVLNMMEVYADEELGLYLYARIYDV
jgi:hypothetical protein